MNNDLVESPEERLARAKSRADMMGITYHPSIGVEKLEAKIAAALADTDEKDTSAPTPESDAQAQAKIAAELIAEAGKLIRVRVTNMNPNTRELRGDIFTVSNAVVGTFKKYVPFNTEEGWHVPNIIYQHLIERQCQIFVKNEKGDNVGKLIREFAIEVLPPLTPEELKELALQQAAAHSID